MPSTKAKNLLYRAALPFAAPSPGRGPVREVLGRPLSDPRGLARIMRRHHVLGGAVLLSSGEDQSLALSGDAVTGRMPEADTYFRVASVTKMATALVALRLAEDGLLDPEAPVSSFLPDACSVPALSGVTLIHLLSHTSGLADPADLESLLESGAPLDQALSGARFAAPGQSFRYSNLAFGIIGCMLEHVSGLPLGELFSRYLFEPLGMNATLEGCRLPEEKIMPVVRVLPYRPGQRLILTPLGRVPLSSPDPLRHYGHTAGSMYTDIGSLRKMLCCIRDGGAPVLGKDSAGRMIKAAARYGAVSPTLSYGLGLLIIQDSRISASRILGHQGFAYGCADGAFWEEDTGRIAIMLNGGCSEARTGRLGLCNADLLRWAFRKEFPQWTGSPR